MTDVLVGVDGSPPSRTALRWAAAVADARGATLRAITAWQYPASAATPTGPATLPAPEEVDRIARNSVHDVLVEELGRDRASSVAVEAGRGPAAGALLARARRPDIGMLVLGARGLGGFEGMVLGSVTQQLVEHVPCPVIVARGDGEATTALPTKIVVGLDGSEGAARALDWALAMAADLGAELVAVHAPGSSASSTLVERADKALHGWCAPIRTAGVVHRARIEGGDPRDALIAVADEEGAGLIVVGTRGMGPVRALLLGSVSGFLIRFSTLSVAVIPSGDRPAAG